MPKKLHKGRTAMRKMTNVVQIGLKVVLNGP